MTKDTALWLLALLCLALLTTFTILLNFPIGGQHTDTLLEVTGGGSIATFAAWLIAKVT